MIAKVFVGPSLWRLQGRRVASSPGGGVRASLSCRLPSVHGRTDFVPVTLVHTGEAKLATPVFGKSAMIGMLARADGYLVIPAHVEGLDQGAQVTVQLFP
jgi:molybdopterin molybdotransferase